MSEKENRRRLVTLGEIIALAALIVSAVGVWITWRSSTADRPTRVVEQHSSVPLVLRGSAASDGTSITITPADPAHGLEGLKVIARGSAPIDVGSDGKLGASDFESALSGKDKQPKDVAFNLPVRIETRYVEDGVERRAAGTYVLRYKWQGGGLFGGRSVHLLALTRG